MSTTDPTTADSQPYNEAVDGSSAAATNNSAAEHVPPTVDVRAELPFLVTNWLSNFGTTTNEDPDQADALARIRHAAAELASAFSSLGSYGTASRPQLSSDNTNFYNFLEAQQPSTAAPHATFADARRRWSSTCPPQQLESLVEAATLGSAVVDYSIPEPIHLVNAAQEGIRQQQRNPESGRTLMDAIAVETSDRVDEDRPLASTLLRPAVVRLLNNTLGTTINSSAITGLQRTAAGASLTLVSDIAIKSIEAANLVRIYLDARDNFQKSEDLLRSVRKSVTFHRANVESLAARRGVVLQMDASTDVNTRIKLLDEIKESEENSNRVLQQLERQLSALEPTHASDSCALEAANTAARQAFRILQTCIAMFRDPVKPILEPGKLNNRLLMILSARRAGLDRLGNSCVPRSIGRIRPHTVTRDTRLTILKSRLSHAVTINTHLAYPVFCLRFDRTGRYFITGADDYLVRVFCLGANVRPADKSIDPASLYRGAVLVCTLRGHAGVINDIDVSSDNGFLATASEDGDCRIWGLANGCPVAILRGHVDGCNMVAWSALTPYRLVTAGADGFARSWDVREACMTRYRKYIGKRPEYRLDDTGIESVVEEASRPIEVEVGDSSLPPSLPAQHIDSVIDQATALDLAPSVPLPVPPLPLPPTQNGVDVALVDVVNNDVDPGQFIANDLLDDGVRLLQKLRHGASLADQLPGPGTRARRAAVRVICVARCPHGRHFATGSDDGICRIWRDVDGKRVHQVDERSCQCIGGRQSSHRTAPLTSDSSDHVLDLKGHISAVTDLHYSSRGDRLLSASQKDGILRIWSWNVDPATVSPSRKVTHAHIVIKLTNPTSSAPRFDGPRRRPVRASTSPISCDVATWICDDTMVVTSQCELVKQSSSAITPGSQYIFLWNSVTGDCLLGIHGAHTMQCPVVLPHPTEPSIVCTGGADGFLKMWDCHSGACFYTHQNTVDYGPIEAHERGKLSGFLDGSFSPDGLTLVVTDDSGRVSLFDCGMARKLSASTSPAWMKEQYFRNDYYDLIYDQHGYCVERGSEQPPHSAPKGTRCSHGGASWSSAVNDGFRHLKGPLPISENEWLPHRRQLLEDSAVALRNQYAIRGNIVSQYNPRTAVVIHCNEMFPTNRPGLPGSAEPRQFLSQQRSPANAHRLSSNWRWGDAFNDLQDDMDDEDVQDAADEDFVVGTERRSSTRPGRNSSMYDSDDGDEVDGSEMDWESPGRGGRRGERRLTEDNDDESDMEDLLEYMSTNNHPTGPFAGDYETYFFKMASEKEAATLSRAWLRRCESDTSYFGRRIYSPQLGDTVVYIPRAHQETISDYPSMLAPWQSWPEGAIWPVALCCIRHIRYRFPYKSYFKQGNIRNKSIVAILTLEVTGVPELSSDHPMGFVPPSFVAPSRQHHFELSLFENDQPDYIVPAELYAARISMVAEAQRQLHDLPKPPIEAMYKDDHSNVEDDEFVPFKGNIETFLDDEGVDPNLQGSGFDAIEVSWGRREGDRDRVSAWEISSVGSVPPVPISRPRLSDEEKLVLQSALTEIMTLTSIDEEYKVESIFRDPVDETKYSDYSTRVEIPMDLSFVSKRLAADYYANILSVVWDIHLIRDNCAKYNGDHDQLTLLSDEMVRKFGELVLSEDQRRTLSEFSLIAAAGASPSFDLSVVPERETRSSRPRVVQRTRSVLENLPPPPSSATRRSSRTRQRSQMRDHAERSTSRDSALPAQRRSTRHVGDAARLPLEQGSLFHSGQGRGRTRAGVSTGVAAHNRALRRPANRTNYMEAPSDNEESEEPRNRIRVRLRRANEAPEEVVGRTDRLGRRQTRSDDNGRPTSATQRTAQAVYDPSIRLATRHSPGARASDSDSEESTVNHRRTSPRNKASSACSLGEDTESHAAESEEDDSPVSHALLSSGSAQAVVSRTNRSRRRLDDSSDDGEDSGDSHGSEADVVDSASVSSDEDKMLKARNRRTSNRATRNQPASKKRGSSNVRNGPSVRRQQTQKSYADLSSSESNDDSSETTNHSEERPKKNATKRRRTAEVSNVKPPKKVKHETQATSQSRSWAFVGKKHISALGGAILARLQEEDSEGIFAEPVAEAYPEVARDYAEAIKKPMDFRTINEERLPWYKSADELRRDLLLVFNNCIQFNGEESEFSILAIAMIADLDDTFKSVCQEIGIDLPRRW